MTTPPPPLDPSPGTATADDRQDVPLMGPSRRKRRKRRFLWLRRSIALLVLAGLLAGVGLGVGQVARLAMPQAPLNLGGAAPGEPINVLVIGVDPTPLPPDDMDKSTRRLADTVHVLSLDYTHHRAYVLTIPRDTRATLGKNGDGALGDGLALGGIPLVKDTVEELTGLTIHHYVWMDMDGAKGVVKELGNTEEYLPTAMKFQDKATGLAMDMAPGWHQLSPEQLLAYASHREPGGDLDRLQRQQKLLLQAQAKLHGTWAALWAPGAIRHAQAVLTSDMPKADFEALGAEWRKVDPHDLIFALLPGEVSPQGEWIMSPQRWEALQPRLTAVPGNKPIADLKPTLEIIYKDPADDKVMALAEALTKQGFQVMRTQTQDVPQDETLVVDRSRADERSQPTLAALDTAVKGARVIVDPGDVTGYGARFTIKLGKGFFR
ncbi:MAG: cell envelope-related transcriptional attenuator domain family protein [Cyanobacteria bacterium RYN_339]|nr:cell envelope-related transcriptional attenuator domain family protein [Cyanobacteria bacterium RYN_339]